MITRRRFVTGASTVLAGAGIGVIPTVGAAVGLPESLHNAFARIERDSGGRLGIAAFDTLYGGQINHRADERFPMCSTFKLVAAGAILSRVDAGTENLDRRIRFESRDIVVNSAITKDRTGGSGMSLAELCEAAMTWSDNTAGNLLIDSLGGPAGLTAYARLLGDTITRLDRTEPDLNEAIPGDPRDTTSPAAMLSNLRTLVLGKALSTTSRDRLTAWLIGNKTGDARLRAGLPKDWRVGDKTGSGEHGTTNDVGIVWPPNRAPLILSIYLTGTSAPPERRNATLAAVGHAVVDALDR